MATTTTLALIKIQNPTKTLVTNSIIPQQKPIKPTRNISLTNKLQLPTTILSTIVTNLATSHSCMAAKQIVESPQQDNRTLALLIPVIPAIAWVLYNILGPALNQINRMRNEKGVVIGLSLSGSYFAALSLMNAADAVAAAEEVVGNESGGNQGGLLALFVAGVVFLEVVLFKTMQSGYESEE